MPNDFVFDSCPQDLKTQVYAANGGTPVPVAANSNGNLTVSVINTPSVNVANIPSVEIHSLADGLTFNASVVNTPSVNVANIPSVEIHSLAAGLTFNASVVNTPSVNVANIPSVEIHSLADGLTFNASVVNTPSVELHSVLTTTGSITITIGSSGVTLTADTSQQRFVSYYINNNPGNANLTAWLQVSPINSDSFFTDDTMTYFQVNAGSILVIATKYYLDYTRLKWDAGSGGTASFIAYYNARV